jgi:hypothetical protein
MVSDEDSKSTIGVFSTGVPANNHLQLFTLQPETKHHKKIAYMQGTSKLGLLPPPIAETKRPRPITINNLFDNQRFTPMIPAVHQVGQGSEQRQCQRPLEWRPKHRVYPQRNKGRQMCRKLQQAMQA